MDPFTAHLPVSHFRPEAYIAPELPPRAAGDRSVPGSEREVDRDRRPNQPAYNEPTFELGFADFLDVINPLQHIPLVGDIYRALTGDQISGAARIAGGTIFGGPLGFVSGIINSIAADAAGQNLGEALVTAVFGDEPELAQTAATAAGPAATPAGMNQVVATAPVLTGAGQAQQPLTGAAALQALGADLRTAERRLAVDPALTRPRPAATFAPVAIDARHLLSLPSTVFTNRMLEGLIRYKALVTEKNAPLTMPVTSVDTIL